MFQLQCLLQMNLTCLHILSNKSYIGGGVRCSSDNCSLLVYGVGHVFSATLKVRKSDLEFYVDVGISTDVQYGQLMLVMDKNLCTYATCNSFARALNSRSILHFDGGSIFMDIRTHSPDKWRPLDGNLRRIDATKSQSDLRIYLYFSEPVLNSSVQVVNVLRASSGFLLHINGISLENRLSGYKRSGVSSMDVIIINCTTNSTLSRQGTLVSASDPNMFSFQVCAWSKWLTYILPIEYYEFASGIGGSIQYSKLPWETVGMDSFMKDSSFLVVTYSKVSEGDVLNPLEPMTIVNGELENALYGKPLTSTEYDALLESQNMKPGAEVIMTSGSSDVWKYFGQNMFGLAVIGGGLIASQASSDLIGGQGHLFHHDINTGSTCRLVGIKRKMPGATFCWDVH